jgi:hypothetical protein
LVENSTQAFPQVRERPSSRTVFVMVFSYEFRCAADRLSIRRWAMGQRYLVAGKRVSMRLWIDEPGGHCAGEAMLFGRKVPMLLLRPLVLVGEPRCVSNGGAGHWSGGERRR